MKDACFPFKAKGESGHGFERRQHHCVVSLSKTQLPVLSTGPTQEGPSRHNLKVVDWDVKNQIKQTNITSLI